MKRTNLIFGTAAMALLASAVVLAQDKPVKMAELPAPVRRTVQQQLNQGATLRGLSTDMEGGQREYEAELTVNGHHRDLAMDANGAITEAEDAIALRSLPASAQSALRKQGRVLSVEEVTHNGAFVAYEAVVRRANGSKHEVRVDKAGHSVPDNG
ncbi:MAG: hypothetical protein ACRD2D_10480 [Terriglobales bacterium]